MSDLSREPMAAGILTDLIGFLQRNESCTGQLSYMLMDGREILIRVKPRPYNMDQTIVTQRFDVPGEQRAAKFVLEGLEGSDNADV